MFHHGLERVRGVDAMIIMTSAVRLRVGEGQAIEDLPGSRWWLLESVLVSHTRTQMWAVVTDTARQREGADPLCS